MEIQFAQEKWLIRSDPMARSDPLWEIAAPSCPKMVRDGIAPPASEVPEGSADADLGENQGGGNEIADEMKAKH